MAACLGTPASTTCLLLGPIFCPSSLSGTIVVLTSKCICSFIHAEWCTFTMIRIFLLFTNFPFQNRSAATHRSGPKVDQLCTTLNVLTIAELYTCMNRFYDTNCMPKFALPQNPKLFEWLHDITNGKLCIWPYVMSCNQNIGIPDILDWFQAKGIKCASTQINFICRVTS